jgi:hypothetical protein
MNCNRAIQLICILLTALLIVPVHAGPPSDAEKEINHLLEYVQASDCTFVRNGGAHNGMDAHDHLKRKYNYLKGKITSPESFIKNVATGSSISGRAYSVRCGDQEVPSAEWFAAELKRFRDIQPI